ncbi:hypothetical protein CKM354_000748100 [Cercospora kikuchii]|uniref:Uncharacterized protein n=1 Tax=Cercospora kikuchii TaxID=84275 RepID=A0A9P3CTX0_9PEZI|nr:uncharacterized protein CKM354_000748100 [Cercospora kikuchii]GIZ44278.1 hypothetical protein CKM354_000748100 [Cercospora kikuchii]
MTTQQENPEDSNDLFSISVDADDYAEAAAGDAPSVVDRTFQSEEDFQKQKASYSAKVHQGNLLEELVSTVPALEFRSQNAQVDGEKVKLRKKEVQLLGYVVGEMHYDRKYEQILELCEKVREICEVEGGEREKNRLEESLERWDGRCRQRFEKVHDNDV